MLFLALPPADMLPPAGHRAGPGRAHSGPIAARRPGGRPGVSPRPGAAAQPRLPHKVAQTPPPAPALPGAAGPAAGAGDRGPPGTGPKSQRGRNPGLESEGRGCLECPGTPRRSPGQSPPPPPRRSNSVQPRGALGAPLRRRRVRRCAHPGARPCSGQGAPGGRCVPEPVTSREGPNEAGPGSATSALGYQPANTIPPAPAPAKLQGFPSWVLLA